jgi:purine-binding chemotaxis protein CheW
MSQAVTAPEGREAAERDGKYLTFALGDEIYGIQILKVREIIGMMQVTPVARTPDYVRGVINLRGKIIPVMDLRRIFAMPDRDQTRETCIVVVDIEQIATGLVVDRVVEVLEIVEDQIEDTPPFGIHVSTDFILGIAKIDNRVTILLDIDKTLSSEEIAIVRRTSEES